MTKKKLELVDLTAAWANAKNRADDATTEVEELRAKILAAGAAIGYRDGFLEIAPSPSTAGQHPVSVIENGQLDQVLGKRRAQVLVEHVSTEKVRALAKLHPDVAEALEAITSRDTPKFVRARAS